MIDMHSHILYGIDDGSRNKEESIKLLKEFEKIGMTAVILTPHYIENSDYMATVTKKNKLIKELQKETSIKLYIGNEVYLSENTINLLKKKRISTLNKSKYLLIELPLRNKIKDADELIYNLTLNKIVPIIAHPERYLYVQDDIEYMESLKEAGALFQANYGSLVGLYGKKVEKTLKLLIKKGYISFMGSDIHRTNYNIDIIKAKKKLKKIVKNQEIVDDLTNNNILKVINNEDI